MSTLVVRDYSQQLQSYSSVLEAMQEFTRHRTPHTQDELWFIQHFPVFTQGQGGKPEHILNSGDIPIIKSDRGGQVTYHGEGQLVVYLLADIRRLGLNIKQLVHRLEQVIINYLSEYHILSERRCNAPGVYVNDSKICSLGLRIRQGYCYHGLALNVAMDLEPFNRINPCGFTNLTMTQLKDLGGPIDFKVIIPVLSHHLFQQLGYKNSIKEIHSSLCFA